MREGGRDDRRDRGMDRGDMRGRDVGKRWMMTTV